MAIPVLLWGAAAALGATGVVKGLEAIGNQSKAQDIGERAERLYKRKRRQLDEVRDETNDELEALGRLKMEIGANQIAHVVSVLNQSKKTKSYLKDFQSVIDVDDLKEMEAMTQQSLELESGLLQGTITGALVGFGVYGTIPLVATASTGTAIASLSGAAATNATLAWLGGGSLAAGGFGMTGGMLALGGIVAGPALAVAGFVMAGKAEEALTQAHEYSAEIDEAVAQFDLIEESLKGLQENAREISKTLSILVEKFESVKVASYNDPNLITMLSIGKAIKTIINTPIMEKDGSPVPDIKHKCSGYLNFT